MTQDRRGRRGNSWFRRFTAGLCTVALATQMACHVYLPLQEVVPASGQQVAVELNDRGRLLIGDRLGESVGQVEGIMTSASDSQVILDVSRTVLLQGSTVMWSGESVSIPREGVRGFRIREYSRSRTVFAAVGAVTGLVLFAGVLTLVGGGNGRPGDGSGCTTGCNEH